MIYIHRCIVIILEQSEEYNRNYVILITRLMSKTKMMKWGKIL